MTGGDGGRVVVFDGDRFLVADPHGDAEARADGLYVADVRVLSRWRLTVDGRVPDLLGGGEDGDPSRWTVYSHLAEGRHGGPGVSVRRRLRVSRAGLRDTVTLTNHGPAPRRVAVRFEGDADFADLLEVRRRELGGDLLFAADLPPVQTVREAEAGTIRLAGRTADGAWSRAVQVSFAPAATPDASGATVALDLPARGTGTVEARVLPVDDRVGSSGGTGPDTALARAATDADDRRARWYRSMPVLETPWTPLARSYHRALADLAALRVPAPGADDPDELVPAAGLPWFMAVFGRDALLTCLLGPVLGPGPARATLRCLARLQAVADDPARDAEPGRIVHEHRVGKVAALGGGLPSYGTVDATPLFVLLAAEHRRWTGEDTLARELEPHLRAAMAWIDGPADRTGRGYVEFARRSPHGLEVQSWKDSRGSMRFADGTRADPPLAVCEVQGYAYAARLGLAAIAREVWADPGYADRLERDAHDLRARFDRDFWIDTPGGGHYALALDGAGRQVDALTSDLGHLLWTGIAAQRRVDRLAAVLLAPELFSGWGVRTMGTAELGHDPAGYHVGAVWPHDTALACAGLARHGRVEEAAVLLRALVDTADRFGGRPPEVLAGYARADTGFPVPTPSSCSPQAWAAVAPIGALTAVLGLAPDPRSGKLTARAAVPADLDLVLRGVPALGTRWDVVASDGRVGVAPAGHLM